MLHPAVYFSVRHGIDRQKRSHVAKDIISQIVRNSIDRSSTSLEIGAEAGGRPILIGHPEIFISLSHSGESLACAATLVGPVGIDLEVPRPQRDLASIAAFAFGPAEQQRAAQEGSAGFYRIWTLREAIAKADGIGLSQAADRQDRVASGPAAGDWRWQGWHLSHRLLVPDIHLALAVRAPQVDAVEWRSFTPAGV